MRLNFRQPTVDTIHRAIETAEKDAVHNASQIGAEQLINIPVEILQERDGTIIIFHNDDYQTKRSIHVDSNMVSHQEQVFSMVYRETKQYIEYEYKPIDSHRVVK